MLSAGEPSKFRFERTITLGHVLTAVTMAATLIVSAGYFDRRVTVIELRQAYSEKSLDVLATQNRSLSDSQLTITKSLERITTILEERSGKK